MTNRLVIHWLTVLALIVILVPKFAGQTNTDSLQIIWENEVLPDSVRFNALNECYLELVFSQPDTVLIFTDYHYQLAEKKGLNDQIVKALNEKGLAYYVLGESDKAMLQLKEALELVSVVDQPKIYARQYANMGSIYRSQNNYQEALQCYNTSLNVCRENNLLEYEADILNNLGLIYYDIHYYELSLDYFERALIIYKQLNIQNQVGSIWLNIGSIYLNNRAYDKCIEYGNKAVEILKTDNNIFSLIDGYFLLAEANRKLNRNEQALEYVNTCIDLNVEINNEEKTILYRTFVADILLETNLSESTKIGEEVLTLIKDNSTKSLKANLYKLLYKCYKAQNKNDLALEMHEKFVLANDSIQLENNQITIVKEAIENEYNISLIKNQLENENALTELKLKQLKKIYSIVTACVVLIGLILLYNRRTVAANRKKREELLEELEALKQQGNSANLLHAKFELNRENIERRLDRKINETDWIVLLILLNDPVIPNKEIAEKAFMSVDGIGSSLRRMYEYFEIKESKYKKISLLMEAIKLSNSLEI